MSECFICGISGEKVKLYEAISKEGIEKICLDCSYKENIPIIKKPTSSQLQTAEIKQTFYQRTTRQIETRKAEEQKIAHVEAQNTSLKDLINKNYVSKVPKIEGSQLELIDNFHWTIMRERRRRHITQKQLAESIGEAETAIRMAERGILPQDNYKLVDKISNFLGIKLRRNSEQDFSSANFSDLNKKQIPNSLEFIPEILQSLTIADLKQMKDAKESDEKKSKMQRLMDGVRKKFRGEEDVTEIDINMNEEIDEETSNQ